MQRLVTLLLLAVACAATSSAAAARVGASTLGAPWLAAIPEVRSAGGVATLALRAALDPNGRPAFFWNGREVAPTIRVHPGDRIRIHYTNDLPEYCGLGMVSATNLHFHGLRTPPVAPGDEVIRTSVAPGTSYDYTVRIERTQPPGLYWYHPHAHRLANWEISNGMAGAIVVEGIADAVPQLAGLRERVIVLRDVPHDPSVAAAETGEHGPRTAVAAAAAGAAPPLEADDYQGTTPCGVETDAQTTINGTPAATIGIRPGERQLWRVLNGSGTRHFDLAVAGLRFGIVALDGVPLAEAPAGAPLRWADHVLVPPGGRAELLVTGPARLPQLLLSHCYDAGPAGDVNPGALLGELVDDDAAGDTGRVAPADGVALDPEERRLPAPAAHRTVSFQEDARGFYIDHRAYAPAGPPAIVAHAGTVEAWTLVNETDEVHAFHIHQVHFIVTAIDGVPTAARAWRDVVDLAPQRRIHGHAVPARMTVLVDFRDPAIRGTFLFHCHLTDHEDGGMMAKVRVI